MNLVDRETAIEEFKKTLVPTKIDISKDMDKITLQFGEERIGLKLELEAERVSVCNQKKRHLYFIQYTETWIDIIHDILNEFIFDKDNKEERSH